MTMNTVFNLSSDTDRTFAIDIAVSPHQAMVRSSAYTVKVPYSALSQTIHSIGKRGGKVVNVRMLSTPMPGIENIPVAAGVKTVAPAQPTETAAQPKGESNRPQSKSKKR
jgi:phycocyanin-associated, rod